jgi:hypothetical protein
MIAKRWLIFLYELPSITALSQLLELLDLLWSRRASWEIPDTECM